MLTPTQPFPALSLPTLDGNGFDTSRDLGPNGAVVVFYRGLHCPICKTQLGEIEGLLDKAAELDIAVVAISGDTRDKARQTAEEAGAKQLRIAHDLSMTEARDWGLHLSQAREGSSEPPLFNEPGIFYLLPDGTVYASWVQSFPFARPPFEDVLAAVKFRLDKGYPPRGSYTGALAEHDGGTKLEAVDGPNAAAY
ncbi:peroxiredoxin-like family protein [Pseudoponticoccus marisrubri]|uniref:peroxiredoxin-like family protein n=1 Tax=Pseudoponticoccus marisrubri TaxID=1685382 RepID=UPI000A028AD2|nr:peroxiredoxin-like family protein [Pseudoponticoccus marisrubri]